MADDSWRTATFRQSVVSKIDEAIRHSRMPTSRNSMEMENHVFQKAKTKEEYLGFVDRLILHVREMNPKNSKFGSNLVEQGFPVEDKGTETVTINLENEESEVAKSPELVLEINSLTENSKRLSRAARKKARSGPAGSNRVEQGFPVEDNGTETINLENEESEVAKSPELVLEMNSLTENSKGLSRAARKKARSGPAGSNRVEQGFPVEDNGTETVTINLENEESEVAKSPELVLEINSLTENSKRLSRAARKKARSGPAGSNRVEHGFPVEDNGTETVTINLENEESEVAKSPELVLEINSLTENSKGLSRAARKEARSGRAGSSRVEQEFSVEEYGTESVTIKLEIEESSEVAKSPVQLQPASLKAENSAMKRKVVAASSLTMLQQNMSTSPVLHSKKSKGNATESKIVKLAIIPNRYPKVKLSVEQSNLIQASLLDVMDMMTDFHMIPQFKDCKLENGALFMTCAEQASRAWLEIALNRCALWENANLKILDAENLPKSVITTVWIPGPFLEPEKLLRRLQAQNKNLDTEMWQILDQKIKENGQELTIAVDEDSLNNPSAGQFKLYLNFGQIVFNILGPSSQMTHGKFKKPVSQLKVN